MVRCGSDCYFFVIVGGRGKLRLQAIASVALAVWEQIAADGFLLRYIPNDFIQGLSKPLVFGGIISITACYFGLATTGGTEGVGQSTTRTVVTSSILILVVDYFLTQLLLSVLSA